LPVLNERTQRELARELQLKLLRYRLLHHAAAVRARSSDATIGRPRNHLAIGLHSLLPRRPESRRSASQPFSRSRRKRA
jgi:hypothetical protein